jgi:hypothetical protein
MGFLDDLFGGDDDDAPAFTPVSFTPVPFTPTKYTPTGAPAPQPVGTAPPAVDLSGIVGALKEASEYAYKTGQENLDWAKQQFYENKEISDEVVGRFLSTQDELNANARKDRARYEGTFQPLQDAYIAEAKGYDSAARREKEAGAAQAAVGQAFDAARDSAVRNLESYGVNPAATRFAALDIGTRMQEAAAKAGAGNAARDNVERTGLAMRRDALSLGDALPGQALASNTVANSAGTGAVNSGLATTTSGANTMGTGTQWAGLGNQGAIGQAGVADSAYDNQLNAWQNYEKLLQGAYGQSLDAQNATNNIGLNTAKLTNDADYNAAKLANDANYNVANMANTSNYNAAKLEYEKEKNESSGLGSLLGLGMSALTSTIPGGSILGRMFAAEGGAVDPEATPGGAIPVGASPTGGQATDDVPAQLTAGEFVIPKDVTSWFGEKYFQNMIVKAREAKAQAGAKPAIGVAPAQAPTFRSRPGAVPMGQGA